MKNCSEPSGQVWESTTGPLPDKSGSAHQEPPGPVRMVRLALLTQPPQNDLLYAPIDPADPDVVALAESVRRFGVKEPLVVTTDRVVLSGNRRAAAARLAGLHVVPCRVEPIASGHPDFLRLLREYNRQRVKSPGELAREACVEVDPAQAHEHLVQYRNARARAAGLEELETDIRGSAKRSSISGAKTPMLGAVADILERYRAFWPLTLRQVHYRLLNNPPFRNARSRTPYVNDRKCYQDLSDLLIRARIAGLVPWDAIDDPTRPIVTWNAFRHVGPFVRHEIASFLTGYWRDLQQGQPCHLEIVGEKNTVRSVIEPVAADYTVPFTLGRGYASATPRKRMAERFFASGRDTLALLVLADHDPEGEDIPQAFARSLRDEFRIGKALRLVKVALTRDQVEELRLPPLQVAKETSSRRDGFVERSGGEAVHELEAVEPSTLQRMLRDAIESVMDVAVFRQQQACERQDAALLEQLRRQIAATLHAIQ